MMEKDTTTNKRTQTHNNIFMNAARLFAEKGYNRVSIREICESVGVGKPTLYYYFKDKETLFIELIDEARQLGKELAHEFLHDQQNNLERLEGFLKIHVAYAERYPIFIRFFSQITFMSLPESIEKRLKLDYDESLDILQNILQVGQDAGEFTKDIDVKLFSLAMLAAVRYMILHDARSKEKDSHLSQKLDGLFGLWEKILLKQ
ncbi:MAG: TetR/AcrR family transcriptional regulator [Calditrichaeota bacterium]|nr:TetR/AcrR family transcriptional regulator [Calditrichota bacterium]